ncbi:hypothetical protein CJ227_00380 [Micrococcus luteus]|nr:hypothetical protein CJ227_00380 [Micrococcus luteus]
MNVTVVIPCYNEAPENLTEAVASVPKDPGTEVIVVDDGSTRRETLEVLDSLGVEVIHQVNAGVAAARNTGIAAGTGRYVLPLDSDDWLRPGFLEPLVRHMDNHDSAIATTACQCFGHKQERLVPPALVVGGHDVVDSGRGQRGRRGVPAGGMRPMVVVVVHPHRQGLTPSCL